MRIFHPIRLPNHYIIYPLGLKHHQPDAQAPSSSRLLTLSHSSIHSLYLQRNHGSMWISNSMSQRVPRYTSWGMTYMSIGSVSAANRKEKKKKKGSNEHVYYSNSNNPKTITAKWCIAVNARVPWVDDALETFFTTISSVSHIKLTWRCISLFTTRDS